MLQPAEAADTIRAARALLRDGDAGLPAELAYGIADLLDEALPYTTFSASRMQDYPIVRKGVRVAAAIIVEWGAR